jgi:hypothetical protein
MGPGLQNFLSHLDSLDFNPVHYGNRAGEECFIILMFWSSGKRLNLPPKVIENPPTLTNISTSNLIICHM